MTTERTLNPEAFPEVFERRFNARDIGPLISGYAPDAVLDLGAGQRASGHREIRGVLEGFLASGLPIKTTPRHATVNGDLAVVTFDWNIKGASPDGQPIDIGGAAVDVLRRDPDGEWRQIIDMPFGVATPKA